MFDDFRRDANKDDSNDNDSNSNDFNNSFFFNDDDEPQLATDSGLEGTADSAQENAGAAVEDASQPASKKAVRRKARPVKGLLGMTPVQTFVLAVMLFMMICLTGFLFLMISGSIQPF